MLSKISYGTIVSAFKFMSGATLLTVILGIATNKIIALVDGTGGIALMGVFRNLINFIVPILSIGITTVVVQKISTASSDEGVGKVISSVLSFLLFQIFGVIILVIFFADDISAWLFGANTSTSYLIEIRIVLVMTIGVLIMQTMIALLNGKVNLKKIAIINVVSSVVTCVVAYPLVKMGSAGIALIVGSGSIIGACLGFVYVRKTYAQLVRGISFSLNIKELLKSLPVSGYLLIHPIIITGTFLTIQAIINRYYGIDGLGLYNAVTMIEGTSIMLLMAAMRTYYLPTLGRLEGQREKEAFINKVLTLLIAVLLLGIFLLIFGSKYILWLLFSDQFIPASDLLILQAIAMLAHAFTWSYAFYLLHEGRYGIYLLLDVLWASLLLGGTWFVASHGFPLVAVAANYLAGCLMLMFLYLVFMRKLYGRGMLVMRNVKLGLSALVILILSCFICLKGSYALQVTAFFIIGAVIYFLLRGHFMKESLA